jgi:hypothetical protein
MVLEKRDCWRCGLCGHVWLKDLAKDEAPEQCAKCRKRKWNRGGLDVSSGDSGTGGSAEAVVRSVVVARKGTRVGKGRDKKVRDRVESASTSDPSEGIHAELMGLEPTTYPVYGGIERTPFKSFFKEPKGGGKK